MTDEGGCAFPLHGIDGVIDYGMSMRDYFAARALPSIIPLIYEIKERGAPIANDSEVASLAARKAYSFADAMLLARIPQGSE